MPESLETKAAKHILIVDDDAMVRLLARAALADLDVRIDEASDGAEAVALFQDAQFDLILLDVEMPILDGLTACERIRSLPGGADVPILIATGLDDAGAIVDAYERGATDFIIKPISWSIFAQRVRYLMRANESFKALRESEGRLHDAHRLAHLGDWVWNLRTGQADWSEEILRIFGWEASAESVSYADFLEAVHPEDRSAVTHAVGEALERQDGFGLAHRLNRADGAERVLFSQGRVQVDDRGEPMQLRFVMQDITERREAEERIHRLSAYDALTGLFNRDEFIQYAQRALSAASEVGGLLALIVLDVDRFKRINDTLGHTAGDEVLRTVAARIVQTTRSFGPLIQPDVQHETLVALARSGGDEFMIALTGFRDIAGVPLFVQHVMEALAAPIQAMTEEVFFSCSVGIALGPEDGTDVNELLMKADTALMHARAEGGNCFRFYATEMNRRAAERIGLEARLNRALENDELELHYQPQIDLATGEVVAFEALLRWFPADRPPVPPGEFIPIAEESGLIVKLGDWVIRAACLQLRAWREAGYAPVRVAVNLASRQFLEPGLVETVTQLLAETGTASECLELELTERILMADAVEVRAKLHALKEIGVKLSVDDFGTGYSSLAYLKRFPLDTLKIDRSFIIELGEDPTDAAIVSAIVALSRGLNLSTIAEGVETQAQRNLLVDLGCAQAQGYLFSRPLPASEVVSFLIRGVRARSSAP
ncbi:putative bifunctional diguanylate cyclase/phosphodiesterase [Thiocystis violacea]|uniref:putative bifunctional diguanylate cyclase/phosphodiesterase n=1 Tax=Thiocystis violacea TaxID=13725 RepID=UPI001907B842|nr:EAL domain-containing protein [Thiocystis violacea]